MANWRLAKSLTKLREQVNEAYPNRDKRSDGAIGNAEHASRSSDHNPWVKDKNGAGVVTALDIDEDLSPTINSVEEIVNAIRASRDPRVKYIIYEGRITQKGSNLQRWQKYTGSNAHKHHVHISVHSERDLYDDPAPWQLGTLTQPEAVPPVKAESAVLPALPLQSSTVEVKTNAATGEVTASPPANEMVVAPPAAVDAGSKKSLWATIISIPALVFGYITQNIGEALGWLKDRETLKWFLIVGGAVFAIYMLRQIVMSAIRQIGAILLTRESMKTLADPDAKNVSVAQTKEVAE